MTWTSRPPTRADADAVVALVCAVDEADFGAPDYDLDALLGEWSEPGVDLDRDAVVFERDGRLAAYGLVLGEDGRAWVHPEHRGHGLGTALAEAVETRARARGAATLAQDVAPGNERAKVLLAARGYALEHVFARLVLPADRAAALAEPAGVRPFEPGDEAAAADVIARAFATTGLRPAPAEVARVQWPDTSLWFVTEDGASGAVRAQLRDGDEGWIAEIGVDPAAGGRGLGTALLHAAARALAARGARHVALSVRASNQGALRLYRRLGFEGDWGVERHVKRL